MLQLYVAVIVAIIVAVVDVIGGYVRNLVESNHGVVQAGYVVLALRVCRKRLCCCVLGDSWLTWLQKRVLLSLLPRFLLVPGD